MAHVRAILLGEQLKFVNGIGKHGEQEGNAPGVGGIQSEAAGVLGLPHPP